MPTSSRRAMSLPEVIVSLACATVITSILVVAPGAAPPPEKGSGARAMVRTLKEATQIKQIHQAIVICSREFGDRFPRPGLIDRQPVMMGEKPMDIPGRGEEDSSANTTANLYAAMIAMNYYTPEICVSELDRNPIVVVDDDYDYEAYQPANDQYWDPLFAADLATGSNASFAHLVMYGDRVKREWRATLNAAYPVLSSRGPEGGERNVESFTCSPHGIWAGNVAFNDNHTEFLDTMTPKHVTIRLDGAEQPDNLFAVQTGMDGADVILSFTREVTDTGATLQHD